MNVQTLHDAVARIPGSFGQRFSRQIAVNSLAAGRTDYAAALVDVAGLDAIPALIEAGASPAVLRIAIETAVMFHYRALPDYIEANEGRTAFAAWCRQAEFSLPPGTPEIVDIYRGTIGCTPAEAAAGLHWSLQLDEAAFYAARYADEELTGVHVLHARVHRSGIAVYVSGNAHDEVVPAAIPADFAVITDKQVLGDALMRSIDRSRRLIAGGGWIMIPDRGDREQAARARMAEAGVPVGTAALA